MTRPPSRAKNVTYAVVAGQSGCLSVGIIIGALLLGLALDAAAGTRGPFTMLLLLASIPVSLFLMVRIALGAVKSIQPPPRTSQRPESKQEEG
jgi:predicted MFS family arabinose efflux permease